MKNEAVALGEDFEIQEVEIEAPPETTEGRLSFLEHISKQHTESLDSLYRIVKEIRGRTVNQEQIDRNIDKAKAKDEIPVGTILKGMTQGTPFWCVVKPDGYYVGINRYESLSAAAQAVSGVRRSGWTFWHFDNGKHEGRTVKEVYRD